MWENWNARALLLGVCAAAAICPPAHRVATACSVLKSGPGLTNQSQPAYDWLQSQGRCNQAAAIAAAMLMLISICAEDALRRPAGHVQSRASHGPVTGWSVWPPQLQ